MLDDVDADGKLKIYVGYMGLVGVQCVGLDGERIWWDRSLPNVLGLVGFSDAQRRCSLLCTVNQNVLFSLGPRGEHRSEFVVGKRSLLSLAAADLNQDGQLQFCALAARGSGRYTAVGFNLSGQRLWSYDLPDGEQQRLAIDPIVPARLKSTGPGQWLLPGADGSIHVLGPDGKLIDRFNYGDVLSGLATLEIGGRPVLLVASPSAVEALEVEP